MVKLEWQNAIMKMTNGQTKIIPVRLDNCIMPTILLQSLYVDLFQNGLEVALRQIVDIANGRNTFSPQFSEFSNLIAYKWWEGTALIIECIAQYYMEPIPNFAFATTNTEEQISYKCKDCVMFNHGFNPNAVHTGEGLTFNAIRLDFPQNIVPGFPQYAEFSAKTNVPIEIFGVLHETQKNQWKGIPMLNKTL